MRKESALVTFILTVLKPGELIESVPYGRGLNTVKSPERSVSVRVVFPSLSNSTDACWIGSPFGSVTLPWTDPDFCWAETLTTPIAIRTNTSVKRCLLIHESVDNVLFLTTEINLLSSASYPTSREATII